MPPSDPDRNRLTGRFRTTLWTVVRRAGQGDETEASSALQELCETYWVPLYAYLRRTGVDPDTAHDHVQGLFTDLLSRGDLAKVAPDRGRFRSYLLTALKNYVLKDHRSRSAVKRGGGMQPISLSGSTDEAEETYQLEPVDSRTPEQVFERRWALTVLQRALDRLAAEQEERGRGDVFRLLQPGLVPGGNLPPHRELADAIGTGESGVKVTLFRLRARYRQLLLDEVADTLDGQEDAEDEIRHLIASLA